MSAGYRARLKRLEASHKGPVVWPHLFITKPDGQRMDLFHTPGALEWLNWPTTTAKKDSARPA